MPGSKQKGAARKEKALKSAYIAVQERLTSGADGRSRTGMEVIQRFLSFTSPLEVFRNQCTLPEAIDLKNLVIWAFSALRTQKVPPFQEL